MIEQALSTLPREAKGPLAAPPMLGGSIQAVADAVAGWPERRAASSTTASAAATAASGLAGSSSRERSITSRVWSAARRRA